MSHYNCSKHSSHSFSVFSVLEIVAHHLTADIECESIELVESKRFVAIGIVTASALRISVAASFVAFAAVHLHIVLLRIVDIEYSVAAMAALLDIESAVAVVVRIECAAAIAVVAVVPHIAVDIPVLSVESTVHIPAAFVVASALTFVVGFGWVDWFDNVLVAVEMVIGQIGDWAA